MLQQVGGRDRRVISRMRGEQGADLFYPAQLGLEALQPGGAQSAAGRFLGVSLPQHAPGEMKGSTSKMLNRKARKRERNDPVEQFFGGSQ